jgi:monoterpene epsilon-lactone hydrolase
MTTEQVPTALQVPARSIPVPTYLSVQAAGLLGMGCRSHTPYPALDDVDAWKLMIAEREQVSLGYLSQLFNQLPVSSETISVGGVVVYVLTPEHADAGDPRVYLEMHGGALISGSGDACRGMGAMSAMRSGLRTWAVDYRMPPDHPFPAALDDCIGVYRELLRNHSPGQLAVGGTSAGGNLAAALVLRARDEGLPTPAVVVLSTPEVDLTESGDSFHTNLGVDSILTESLMPANLLYADGHDLADPYLSPLFGDFTKGFSPTILTTGTRDLFLSNTVRMHRALRSAGIPAELHVMEAAPHGGFFGSSPEDAEIGREVRRFVGQHCVFVKEASD